MAKFKVGDKVKLNPNMNHDHYVFAVQERIGKTYIIYSMENITFEEGFLHRPTWIYVDTEVKEGHGFYSYEKYLKRA